jgi:ABC-type transport system involved in multi-copper enzyme maturation permease subunit
MTKLFAIAVNTVREAIRNKVLYSILFFAVLVVMLAAVFGAASIGDQMKFIKDFSLMSISLFAVIIAIVLGVSMLHKELGKKTILNILSKPVPRWQFIAGKFVGLLLTVTMIVALMCGGLLAFLATFEGHADWNLALAAATALLELMVIIAVALFFSSIVVTPTLAGLFTAATFVAGRSAYLLDYFFQDEYRGAVTHLARVLWWVLPHLNRFNIADQVVYGNFAGAAYLGAAVVYAVAYTCATLLLSVAIFSRREFT